MKKLYLTLASVAVTAASALAVQPKTAEMQVFDIKDGKVPSQEVINKHLRIHGAASYEAVGKLVDGKIATGINVYAQEAIESHKAKFGVKSNAPAKKVRKASENKVDLNGNYVNFYLPYFTNQISGKEVSYGVVVTMDENNKVTFDGLCGTGVVTGSYSSSQTNNKNLTGTYDPATGLITCPGGQVLTTVKSSTGNVDLIISPADLANGKFTNAGDIVFEVKEDGSIVCQSDLYQNVKGSASAYGAELSPVLQPATGMISYTSSIAGEIKQPYWYKLTKNDAGEDVLLMSGLDQYQAAGYTTEWKVNADGKTATATNVVGWSNKSTAQDLTFYVSTETSDDFEPTCTVDFSNKDNIVLPANGSNWSLYDATGYWTGRNTQAKITPVEKVEPGEEPGEEPSDHGKGTTVAYINCFKPFFSNFDADKTLTEVVYVTTYEDNYVEIDGIGGIGVEACKGNSNYSDIVNLHGTYDPATKTITIPEEQVLGKYAGIYDIAVFVGSSEGGSSLWYAPIEFTINAEGQLVCSGQLNTTQYGLIPADMIYIAAMQSNGTMAGALAGQYSPIFNPANGKINYNFQANTSGTIDEPFYYAVVTKGSRKVLRTSNLANRAGEGYMVEFAIDEAAKTATATNAATYNTSSAGDYILKSSLTGSSSDLTSTVVADITDLKKIILPKEGYWTCITASNSYFGWNFPATITGTPVELQEEDDVDLEKPVIAGIHYSTPAGATSAEVIGCDAGLTDLNIPAEIEVAGVKYPVTSVAEAAFQANKTITSISIPASIKTVGQDAFRNVQNLKTLNIADLKAWCGIEFANGNANPIYNVFPTTVSKWGTVNINGKAVTTTLDIPEGVTAISRSFYGFKSLTTVTLPSTLVTLGDQAFANCIKIEEMTVPEGVKTMGSAFFGCEGLKKVTLPSTLTSLGGNAFYSCKALETVNIPEGIPSIGASTFNGCKALKEITIPASVESIGSSAFYGCSGLTKITSNAVVPPAIVDPLPEYDILADVFVGVDKNIPVYVPAGSVEDYKKANEWEDFTNITAMQGSAVEEIEAADADAIYYDLNGRRVNGELGSGLYIRVQGNKASKVLVK